MKEDRFTGGELTDAQISTAIAVANDHIGEAENLLWKAANKAEQDEHAADLEDVTREVWDIQHTLLDLQEELES
ncbi:hypothetical protein [Halorubrum halophilum]|uniref:hypothetical protein n=1 Tax=Halorubrum halophilum TaxID=413816 RepID=UPI00186B1B75|nr:hypothetical protein [Halorubrum halophilum]